MRVRGYWSSRVVSRLRSIISSLGIRMGCLWWRVRILGMVATLSGRRYLGWDTSPLTGTYQLSPTNSRGMSWHLRRDRPNWMMIIGWWLLETSMNQLYLGLSWCTQHSTLNLKSYPFSSYRKTRTSGWVCSWVLVSVGWGLRVLSQTMSTWLRGRITSKRYQYPFTT